MGKFHFLSFALCVLLLGEGVSAVAWPWRVMGKRDDAPFVPVRKDIPLQFDSQGKYVITVAMNTQRFNFTMTTGSGLTYVAGTQCVSCHGVNLYDQSKSTTAQQMLNTTNVAIFNATTSASLVKEDCALTMKNGSLWSYPNQTIVVTDRVTSKYQDNPGSLIGSGVSGMVGLGSNRNLAPRSSSNNSSVYGGNFEDAIGGQWLLANPQADNFTFGLALNSPIVQAALQGDDSQNNAAAGGSPANNDSPAGTVHMLQPDHSFYSADTLSWATVDNSLNPEDDPQDWTVPLNGWILISDGNQVNSRKTLVANVDPLYQGMYFPLDSATLIHSAIPGSVLLPTISTLGSLSQTWKIPCDSKITFGIIVGSQTYTLDSSTLVIKQSDGTCISGIEAWTSSNLNSYLLGARFISAVYLIFNVPRDGPATLGFASREVQASHKTNVGAIVGGTIGGVALVIFSGIAIWWLFIHHRRTRVYAYDVSEEDKNSHNVQPYPLFPPQSEVSSSPTQGSFYQTATYRTSTVPGSEPSPSQILFAPSQVSTPSQTPNMPLLFAQNAGSEDVPPAYESGEQSEHPTDVKNRNLYQTVSSSGEGSSNSGGPQ
ncbi:unnamed protein product [Somion occarium]|uniref:Peptidase A1 domain-containing protein n=1 Tax=Somion occarium TaxID=3059160 RepID=A0ABP1CW53_9APHY